MRIELLRAAFLGIALAFALGCEDDGDDSDGAPVAVPDNGTDGNPDLTWVSISGGSFEMGCAPVAECEQKEECLDFYGGVGCKLTCGSGCEARLCCSRDELPAHAVAVADFEMLKTEVTVAQYRECFQESACTAPAQCGETVVETIIYDIPNPMDVRRQKTFFNWGEPGRGDHPVNCVTWDQARAFCAWAGGRLPSESEWEYAARNGSDETIYPWGDHWDGDLEMCRRYLVMTDINEGWGCGTDTTAEVCSRSAYADGGVGGGETLDGLCDMAGNVREWVEDWYHPNYAGAPADGSAWSTKPEKDKDPCYDKEKHTDGCRVRRGSSYSSGIEGQPNQEEVRAANRSGALPTDQISDLGFRCARNVEKGL